MRATLNRNADSVVEWNPCDPGKYFLRIVYMADALPHDVRENFFNPQHPPSAVWEAALTLTTKDGTVFSTNKLNLEAGGLSGDDAYFLVGQVDLKKSANLEIRLTPSEPAPFGANPSIALGPSGLYYENYMLTRLLWFISTLACIPIGILLLFDLLRRKRNSKQPEPCTASAIP
jgi:hypothetical protein